MFDKISQMKPQQLGLILLGLLFLPATLFFQPNLGGEGMSISHNITVWVAAVFVISAASLIMLNSKQFSYPSTWMAMAALPISMIILGFIIDSFLPEQWFFRQLYILGGFLFLIALFQFRFTNRDIEKAILILLISGIIHGLYGVSQILYPNILPLIITPSQGTPYSVFQQINLHASFQTTILILGLYLLSRPITLKPSPALVLILLSSIFLSSLIVTYSGSRTGFLAAVFGILLLSLCNWRSFLSRKALSIATLITITAALTIGYQGLQRSFEKFDDLTEEASLGGSNSRIHIYKISYELLKQKPVSGHGIGSFQKVWHDHKVNYLKRFPEANLPSQRLSHPHNELIFWLIEGGLIAIAGILISITAVTYIAFSCGWRRGGSYIAMLTPIGLHTQVELPFYISAIPWLLLLFIVYLILRHKTRTKPLVLSRAADLTAGYTTVFLCVGVTFILLHTIQANNSLVRFLKGGMKEPAILQPALNNPFFSDQAEIHIMRMLLFRELSTQQRSFTPKFILWASEYIKYTPIPQLYIDLSHAYLATGEKVKAIETIEDGLARYPEMKRLKQRAHQIKGGTKKQLKTIEESSPNNSSKTSELTPAAPPIQQPGTPTQ